METQFSHNLSKWNEFVSGFEVFEGRLDSVFSDSSLPTLIASPDTVTVSKGLKVLCSLPGMGCRLN